MRSKEPRWLRRHVRELAVRVHPVRGPGHDALPPLREGVSIVLHDRLAGTSLRRHLTDDARFIRQSHIRRRTLEGAGEIGSYPVIEVNVVEVDVGSWLHRPERSVRKAITLVLRAQIFR